MPPVRLKVISTTVPITHREPMRWVAVPTCLQWRENSQNRTDSPMIADLLE